MPLVAGWLDGGPERAERPLWRDVSDFTPTLSLTLLVRWSGWNVMPSRRGSIGFSMISLV